MSIEFGRERREMEKQNQSVSESFRGSFRERPTRCSTRPRPSPPTATVRSDDRGPARVDRSRDRAARASSGSAHRPSTRSWLRRATTNYLVRVPAIWALEHIGDARAVDPLVANLNGTNECCRWTAAAALSKIGGENGRAAGREHVRERPCGPGDRRGTDRRLLNAVRVRTSPRSRHRVGHRQIQSRAPSRFSFSKTSSPDHIVTAIQPVSRDSFRPRRPSEDPDSMATAMGKSRPVE